MLDLGAVLRCCGSRVAVKKFLADTRWKPLSVYWKGELRAPKSKLISAVNGFNVNVSDGPSSRQAADARAFLKRNIKELRKLKKLKLHWIIDFSVELDENDFTRSMRLPAALLDAVAKLGGEIEVSAYAAPDSLAAG